MLEAMQVIVEAYPVWKNGSYYTAPVNYSPADLLPYDAAKALKHIQDEYPDDPFWENPDWTKLVSEFIQYADGRLAETGCSYKLEMGKRTMSIAEMQLRGSLPQVRLRSST